MAARKLAVLKFQGDVERGFQVTLEIHRAENYVSNRSIEKTGVLPSPTGLMRSYWNWQTAYRDLGQPSRVLKPKRAELNSFKQRKQTCTNSGQVLRRDLNDWLRAISFMPIRETWLKHISVSDQVSVMIRSQAVELWQLPWQEWDFWQDYKQLEVSFSPLEYEPLEYEEAEIPQPRLPSLLKILVILGDTTGINAEADRHFFEQLGAQAKFLTQPKRQDLISHLQNHAYDFLFFAGHSRTERGLGYIDLNPADSLTLEELRSTLRQAIQNGLRLAIFNSCDGLGLVKALETMQLSYLIVMREPVPDQIAQIFLKILLQKFSSGTEFQIAVEEARKELKKFEDDFPYASWLPLVWKDPLAQPLRWRETVVAPIAPVLSRTHRFRSIWHSLQIPISISLICGAAAIGLRLSGVLQLPELVAFDQMMRLRPDEGSDPHLLIIEITDADVEMQKQNGEQMQRVRTTAGAAGKTVEVSLSDQSLERLLAKLAQPEYRPQVIGLDLYRDFPTLPQHPKLKELLQNLPVFAICKAEDFTNSNIPTIDPPLEVPMTRIGFNDVQSDDDLPTDEHNFLRRHLLRMEPKQWSLNTKCTSNTSNISNVNQSFNSFSVQIAFFYLKQQGIIAAFSNEGRYINLKLNDKIYRVLQAPSGGYQKFPFGGGGSQIMLNYRSTEEIATRYSLTEFLNNKINPVYVKDKIVLIGIARTGQDLWQIPYRSNPSEPVPGLIVQAHMTSQLVNAALPERQRPLIQTAAVWMDGLWILGWSLVGGLLIWQVSVQNFSRQWFYTILAILLVEGTLYWVCFGLLWLQGSWVPLIPAAIGLVMSVGAVKLYLISQTPRSRTSSIQRPPGDT